MMGQIWKIYITLYFQWVDPTCPENEVFADCASACQDFCNKSQYDFCIMRCDRACVCKDGYTRQTRGGTCIPKEQCPDEEPVHNPENVKAYEMFHGKKV
jgi:hypothetical protein